MGHVFGRMSVKIRNEIVTMGAKVTQAEVEKYRKELTPEEFKNIIDEEKTDEYLILDMRNDYEYRLGHFKGAIPAGTVNFREVPKLLEQYKEIANGRKIIWYCTGGIRCEKAAVLAGKAGMEDVYAIEGGVVKYVNTYNDGNWLGNLYTFDDRVSTVVGDTVTHVSIGECLYTGEKTDNCMNCRYAPCNARLIATDKAYREHLGFCSLECYNGARNDSLVKVVNWDKFDYKSMGKMTRNGEPSFIQEHLDKKLAKKVWKHITSQKEVMICEC